MSQRARSRPTASNASRVPPGPAAGREV